MRRLPVLVVAGLRADARLRAAGAGPAGRLGGAGRRRGVDRQPRLVGDLPGPGAPGADRGGPGGEDQDWTTGLNKLQLSTYSGATAYYDGIAEYPIGTVVNNSPLFGCNF